MISLADLDRYRRRGAPDADYPPNVRTFYAPVDDVHGVLRALIRSATSSLVLAMYAFADDELGALVATKLDSPDIYCQITLDKSQSVLGHEAAILARYRNEFTGNSVAIGNSERGAIMHRKMLLIDGIWRVTGSTNWSTSGETLQDNELTVIRSASACAEARAVLDIAHDAALKQMARAKAA